MPSDVPRRSPYTMGSHPPPHLASSILCLKVPLWVSPRASAELLPLLPSLEISVKGLREELSEVPSLNHCSKRHQGVNLFC